MHTSPNVSHVPRAGSEANDLIERAVQALAAPTSTCPAVLYPSDDLTRHVLTARLCRELSRRYTSFQAIVLAPSTFLPFMAGVLSREAPAIPLTVMRNELVPASSSIVAVAPRYVARNPERLRRFEAGLLPLRAGHYRLLIVSAAPNLLTRPFQDVLEAVPHQGLFATGSVGTNRQLQGLFSQVITVDAKPVARAAA